MFGTCIILKSYLYVVAYISRGYYNADMNNIVVNTCQFVYWKTQNFSGKYNILPFEKRAEHLQ